MYSKSSKQNSSCLVKNFLKLSLVLTLHFDAGGGGGLAVHVDRLAGVDTRVSGPQAGDVESDQAEVKGSLDTGT